MERLHPIIMKHVHTFMLHSLCLRVLLQEIEEYSFRKDEKRDVTQTFVLLT